MKNYTVRRFLLFAIALFINALGIAFITKALLGTSPITSVTYVLSMFTPLTMGQWTIALNLLFVALEWPLMSRQERREDWKMYTLQIPIALCFGTFIDISMNMLAWVNPELYVGQIFYLLVGCVILAAGVIHGMFVSGGALLVIYASSALKEKEEFRATMAMLWVTIGCYITGNQIKSGFFNSRVILLCAVGLIPLFVGIWAGTRLVKKIHQETFLKLTYVLLIISGVLAII